MGASGGHFGTEGCRGGMIGGAERAVRSLGEMGALRRLWVTYQVRGGWVCIVARRGWKRFSIACLGAMRTVQLLVMEVEGP